MLTGGDWLAEGYAWLLIPRRTRTFVFESLLAWSRCRFSSRCSGVKIGRGGLDVKDLEPLGGGVRLLISEPCPTPDRS
jgi:hypothetical protein